MSGVPDARKLTAAAYAAARAKLLRGGYTEKAPEKAVCDMTAEEHATTVAKNVRDMTSEEYAIARRRFTKR